MSKGRIAPVRPSIAKILKRQIGGFIREYDREVSRPAEPAKKPPAQPVTQPPVQPGAQPEQGKREETPPQPPEPTE